jgi:hypothetical protein
MPAVAGCFKNHGGHAAIAELMRQSVGIGILLTALAQLRPQLADAGESAIEESSGHAHHLAVGRPSLASRPLSRREGWGIIS